eukprot:763698-Hanusia_phi.AAC.2
MAWTRNLKAAGLKTPAEWRGCQVKLRGDEGKELTDPGRLTCPCHGGSEIWKRGNNRRRWKEERRDGGVGRTQN